MSKADLLKYIHSSEPIPEVDIPIEGVEYWHNFWDIRNLVGDPEKPVTFAIIDDWQRHTYNVMQKYERDFIFAMDRAFRHGRIEMLKYHAKRPKINLEDNDRQRMGNKRR